MMKQGWIFLSLFVTTIGFARPPQLFIEIEAKNKVQRSQIANHGVSIETVRTDSVWAFADKLMIKNLKDSGFQIKQVLDLNERNIQMLDFPSKDEKFHNYDEVQAKLRFMQSMNADIAKVITIGKSVQGRDLVGIHFNTDPTELESGMSTKPGIVFIGTHHAREHLSTEVPLLLADYLMSNRANTTIANLLETRDIWIIPLLNPDGSEYDIEGGRYKSWRKNRRNNGRNYGVDLNRNYGYEWGTGGSSKDTSSDVYMGTEPFSEPETQAVKSFVETHTNLKILLSYHSFSELILYPWGHTYDPIDNTKDRMTFEKMAQTMATYNKYKPQQSSDLYIASGDTTDWAYGEHNIFAFTFELSPANIFAGGFYPGQGVIERVVRDNIQPALYLIDLADDPYRALDGKLGGRFLPNIAHPSIPPEMFLKTHPF